LSQDEDRPIRQTPPPGRSARATRTGVVDSISGTKTVRVAINTLVRHPLYGKYVRRRTRLLAHDPTEEARPGDTVELASCRPISKRKSWRVVRVLRRSDAPQVAGETPPAGGAGE